jgi:hypothetical protein
MSQSYRKDLVALVADKNMEFILRSLLGRPASLATRSIEADVFVHLERDPGCRLRAHDFLRSFQKTHDRALAVFDREGCGREAEPRSGLETEVELRLAQTGWGDRAAAVVIDPEVESWIWADSPQVDITLGWTNRVPDLRGWLVERGFQAQGGGKPSRPTEAVEEALRVVRKPRSSALYAELAARVGVEGCIDPAFLKLRRILSTWFPAQPGRAE